MMKRVWLVALAVAVLVSPVWAAEETVTFTSGPERASGFLVTPAGKGPFKGCWRIIGPTRKLLVKIASRSNP